MLKYKESVSETVETLAISFAAGGAAQFLSELPDREVPCCFMLEV
jgi:hypothetical protein